MDHTSTTIYFIDRNNNICHGHIVAAHWDDKLLGYSVHPVWASETVFVTADDVAVIGGAAELFCDEDEECMIE